MRYVRWADPPKYYRKIVSQSRLWSVHGPVRVERFFYLITIVKVSGEGTTTLKHVRGTAMGKLYWNYAPVPRQML